MWFLLFFHMLHLLPQNGSNPGGTSKSAEPCHCCQRATKFCRSCRNVIPACAWALNIRRCFLGWAPAASIYSLGWNHTCFLRCFLLFPATKQSACESTHQFYKSLHFSFLPFSIQLGLCIMLCFRWCKWRHIHDMTCVLHNQYGIFDMYAGY